MPHGKKRLQNPDDIYQPEQAKQPVATVDHMQAFILCFFSDYGSYN
jgi:hypothetical protein